MPHVRSSAVERLWRLPLFSLGVILVTVSLIMALTAAVNAIAGESAQGIAAGALVALFVGAGLVITFREDRTRPRTAMSLRSAFLLTALGWIGLPLFAAAPFMADPASLGFTDAVFEAVSGLTTTGSTVIVGLDDFPKGLLLWRSLLQWIGGVGIIVVAVVLMPSLRVGGMQLFQLESTEASSDRVVPQAGALILWILGVYVALSLACLVAFLAVGMSPFDAVNHAMTTIATGGLSTHDRSLGWFDSDAVNWTACLFMLAGAVPFMVYLKAIRGRLLPTAPDAQVPFFFALVVLLVGGMCLARWIELGDDVVGELSHIALNVISVLTTTGLVIDDYQLWGPGYVGVFFALTFFGGCAGSTTGGIKIYRFQLLFLIARDYMRRLYEPNVVVPRRYGGALIDDELTHSVLAFIATYVAATSLGSLVLGMIGLDFVTAFTGAAQAIGNVGVGLGDVIGPAGTFRSLPDAAKWVLIGLMLLGRLELFALLVLLDPRFWRK